ncbi:TetR/AcrR family transcriptional regulator [Novosphingobium sp. FSW06-99]|uniref:TetR/AcrR family transcriptional regulator n=1 Tax=Novosphingobium sp. FSW06-99 TaxID=1739113 RepID=UPI000B12CBDF|nr:TetR/AcrR family transcriptional regulator [Novosphingobium sp. FSW06-99]
MSVHAENEATQKRAVKARRANGKAEPDANGRGSRDLWLDAACDLFLQQGVAAVMIQPLSKRLKLSRTSFYWFFTDREELLDALLERWRDRNTGAILRQAEAYAESVVEATLNLFDCWLNSGLFDTKFEFAVRSWALQSEAVAAEIKVADQLRIEAIAAMYKRFGYPPIEADVRARTVYLTQIGYISMQTVEAPEVRMPRIANYVEIFTGKTPEQREIDRFFGRHRFHPQGTDIPA